MSENKDFDIHPLIDVSKRKYKSISPIKVGILTVLISYVVIAYLFYDYYKSNQKEPLIKINEEYLNVEEVVKSVETALKSNLTLDTKDVKSEEEIIKDIASKSLNLPDLKELVDKTVNLPPPQVNQNQITQQVQIPQSRYEYFLQKAKEYEAMGNYKYAIFFYLRAFVENQSDYETKFKVAQLYYRLGQIPLAAESAKDSLRIKSDYLPALQFLSELYLKTGYKDDSLKTFLEQGLNKYPNEKSLVLALAKIYKDENNIEAYNNLKAKLENSNKP
ncbi:MAG: tetratricopeptide repeat protein [Sulfurihydrogenibium sp.]